MRQVMGVLLGFVVLAGCGAETVVPSAVPGEDALRPATPSAGLPAYPTEARTPTPVPSATPSPTSSPSPTLTPEPSATRPRVTATRTAVPATPTPDPPITLTILYDNNRGEAGLGTAWGFACLVQGLEQTILFDTGGDGALLLRNMAALNVRPGDVDVIVLSHAHADHTGGLSAVLAEAPGARVYLLSSFPQDMKRRVTQGGGEAVEVEEAMMVCPKVWLTGAVGTRIPEQALVLESRAGLVVITGCAHPGVVAMVQAAQTAVGNAGLSPDGAPPVDLVFGGFHLSGASPAQIEDVATALREQGVQRTGPCHCSGDRAREIFGRVYGEDYVPVAVGTRLTLN